VRRAGTELELPFTPDEAARARGLAGPEPYAVVHPGAQLASRRWPAARFAAVADALGRRGLAVVLTGTAAESEVTAAVRAAMRLPARDLAGRTRLGELAALVAGASLLVCNDTGVSHVAAATRTPSVVVACGSDPSRWAPLDRTRHRVLWHPVACRPCSHARCPTAHECALGVPPGAVLAAAGRLLRALSRPWPSVSAS
jgi:ADP-heptose:LPS heptosyltransferase